MNQSCFITSEDGRFFLLTVRSSSESDDMSEEEILEALADLDPALEVLASGSESESELLDDGAGVFCKKMR